MKYLFPFFALLGGLVCLSGCSDGGENTPQNVTTTRSYQDLRVTFTASQGTYAVGSDIPAKITLTNTGSQSLRLDYSDCGPSIVVLNGADFVYGNPNSCISKLPIILQAGETKEFNTPWVKTQNLTGGTVSAGTYFLNSVVLFNYNGEKNQRDFSSTGVQVQVR